MRFLGFRTTHCLLATVIAASVSPYAAAGDDFKSDMQQAFDLHQKARFSEALPLLRRAYRIQPEDYFVNLLLGIDTLRVGDAKGAVSFLKKASRLHPHEEFPLAYLGESYAQQSLYGDAAEAYIKAAGVEPSSVDSAVTLVDFFVSRFGDLSAILRSSKKGLAAEYRLRVLAMPEGDVGRAAILQHAADLDPEQPGVWSDLAHAALVSGDRSAAQQYLHRALQADSNDLEAWMVEAQAAADAGDWKLANSRLNAVAERSPQTLAGEVSRWPKQLKPTPGEVSGSAAKFLTCVNDDKENCDLEAHRHLPQASPTVLFREQRWEQLAALPTLSLSRSQLWTQRGIAFAHLGECNRAIPALERGIAAKPSDTYAMFLLSRCYSLEAGHTATQLHDSGDDQASLHVMRGDILLRLQANPDDAAREYQQALGLQPNDPSVFDRLAEAQFGAGNNESARASAEAALHLDPQRTGAKRTLAKIAMQERDYAVAQPYLRELAERNPDDLNDRIELAKACAQTGALDDARKNLTAALDRGYPDEKGSLHYLLGSVLKKMGREAESQQAFASAAQLSEAFQSKSYHDQDPDAP